MLMTKKRFRYDTRYVYGSVAVVTGFGVIMALLVNFAPMKVPGSNTAVVPENAQKNESNETAINTGANTTPQNDTQAQPSGWSSSMMTAATQPAQNNSGSTKTPVVTDSPTVPETPVTPSVPAVPVTPEVPVVPTVPVEEEPIDETPIIEIPILPILDPVLDIVNP